MDDKVQAELEAGAFRRWSRIASSDDAWSILYHWRT
jgi:hypothetical protein